MYKKILVINVYLCYIYKYIIAREHKFLAGMVKCLELPMDQEHFIIIYKKRYRKIHLNDLISLLKRLPNVIFGCYNSKRSLTQNYLFFLYIVKYAVKHFLS